MISRIRYRTWQFWKSLRGKTDPADQEAAAAMLSPEQYRAFLKMTPADQNHCLRVFQELRRAGVKDPELLTAALLHDLGKQEYPLRIWERAVAVLLAAALPGRVKTWENTSPDGIHRPLVVVRHHPAWGADRAQDLGCSSLTVWLIRNHENGLPKNPPSPKALEYLTLLQEADNHN